MCTYEHKCTRVRNICERTYVYTCVWRYICVRTYARMYMYVRTHTYVCTCRRVRTYVYLQIKIWFVRCLGRLTPCAYGRCSFFWNVKGLTISSSLSTHPNHNTNTYVRAYVATYVSIYVAFPEALVTSTYVNFTYVCTYVHDDALGGASNREADSYRHGCSLIQQLRITDDLITIDTQHPLYVDPTPKT